MVAHLAATSRYRILQKLEPRRIASGFRPELPHWGVIFDTETSGFNHRKDETIEIDAISVTFDEHGAIGDITGVYGGLQEPRVSIPAHQVGRHLGLPRSSSCC